MKKYILPKDYHELDAKEVDIYLIQGGSRLLLGMDAKLGDAAKTYLEKMGVHVRCNTRVIDIENNIVKMKDGNEILANKVIWAAGVTCNEMEGINEENYQKGNRLKVNAYNQLTTDDCIFALGDAAYLSTEDFPQGFPQIAQPAIQQAKNLVRNIKKHGLENRSKWKVFKYKNLGTMATVGRNKAVVELPRIKFKGFFAWSMWLVVHLYALIGVRNKLFVMINWLWNYITYDQSLRLIIRPKSSKKES